MRGKVAVPKSIDEYIAGFPNEIGELLQKVRISIGKAAPQAKERISYEIPTFTLHGNLVHFAAFKRHIGFYPTSSAIRKFEQELSTYVTGKGSVQFPLDRPIPFDLIGKITKFRVEENLQKADAGKKRRTKVRTAARKPPASAATGGEGRRQRTVPFAGRVGARRRRTA
jgi:uncharacterized protein YdhG (YjbR/CyaY superfamily)